MHKLIITGALCSALTACGTVDRLKMVGKAPPLSPMDQLDAPTREGSLAYQTLTDPSVARAGAGAAPSAPPAANASLFRSSARAFFADQRANRTGDILTVRIRVDDRAQVDNSTSRSRSNSENAGLPALLGLETQLQKVLPNAVNPGNLVSGNSQSNSSGSGQIQRRDTVNLTVAAIVTGVLPNGNLVIRGRQEVRVNFEVRELIIAGIVRPEDISRTNTIDHTQIAEARISYGGRGQLTDVQQARYGQQIYDALFPF
jgi:flagellar L-ring protein precursor FlgH